MIGQNKYAESMTKTKLIRELNKTQFKFGLVLENYSEKDIADAMKREFKSGSGSVILIKT